MKGDFCVFILILILAGCGHPEKAKEIDLPFYNTPDLTPVWVEPNDPAFRDIHTIRDFEFVNQNGETITNELLDGKIYVANFFFTICPGVCPKMNGNLHLVQDAFADDDRVMIVSHSVMPWVDTVAQLQRYAERNDINSGTWQLLTGDKSTIYRLARESYFADEGFGKELTSPEDFLHTEKVILVDRKRRIRGIYNGTLPLDIKRMIKDIKGIL